VEENMSAMRRASRASIAVFTLLVGSRWSEAQFGPAPVFGGAPPASWIADADAPGIAFGVFHFRRSLRLAAPPEHFVVHVSADNRYRFFVNGQQLSSGPQRSDLMHWRYETLDLGPHLRAGENVLAALVWNWGPYRPVAQFSRRTAFLLQGDTDREAVANTGPEWKVLRNPGYAPIPVVGPAAGGYYAAPPGESVDGARYPWGWEQVTFADDTWRPAAVGEGRAAERTQTRGTAVTGEARLWQLVPRSIPRMEEKVVRFATVRRAEGIPPSDAFLKGEGEAERSCYCIHAPIHRLIPAGRFRPDFCARSLRESLVRNPGVLRNPRLGRRGLSALMTRRGGRPDSRRS
jgi:hypothetical protein